MCEDPGLLRQLDLLRTAKLMRLALICQDMADGLMAVNDITGETAWLRVKATLRGLLHCPMTTLVFYRSLGQHDAHTQELCTSLAAAVVGSHISQNAATVQSS